MAKYKSKISSKKRKATSGFCFACYHACSISCSGSCSGGCNTSCSGDCYASCNDGCYGGSMLTGRVFP